ncbi:MAG: CPBP family intramembrane glutamic endopeptidase [Pseudomonadota bacterium]
MNGTRPVRVACFIALSLASSYTYFVTRPLGGWVVELPHLVAVWVGLVPALALAIIAVALRAKLAAAELVTLTGGRGAYSVLMLMTLPVSLAVLGLPNAHGVPEPLYGLVLGILVTIYALLEELGWRGYLQQEFRYDDGRRWLVYASIGSVWYLWHWFFLRSGGVVDAQSNLVLWLLLIAASAGLGELVAHTRSILASACAHALGNVLFMYALIADRLDVSAKGLVLCVALVAWWPLLRRWRRA